MAELSKKAKLEARLEGLRQDRYSWWVHWNELATFILPRRYRWLITPNQANRGSAINNAILDNTGTMAARVLSSGMMSGMTSPTRPWWRPRVEGFDTDTTTPVSLWLEEVYRRMSRVMQESNFYEALATMWLDEAVFGTAVVLIYEDFDDVIRCYTPCAGEYFIANSDRMAVNVVAREFTLTVAQTVGQFGEGNCSRYVREAYRRGGAELSQEVKIAHLIGPADGYGGGIYPFKECYWEVGSDSSELLRENGFWEWPAITPRWDLVGNDAYGRSPSMDALGDIKQLQQETRRKAQAIDKMVNPPLLADIQLKNQPSSALPGGITYVSGLNNSASAGMRPIYTVNPQVGEIMQDIMEVQQRIQRTFFNDLFLMISQLDTVRTATEIDARREEKLIQLGPVLERNENELDKAISRIFAIMVRAKLFPPPPPELEGRIVQIEYSSMLAEAQRAVASTSIERILATAGNLVAVQPDIMDNLDTDECIDEMALLLNVPPRLVRSRDDLNQIRMDRAKEQAAANALTATTELAAAGKTLSETQVGGGQNALEAAISGQTLPGTL